MSVVYVLDSKQLSAISTAFNANKYASAYAAIYDAIQHPDAVQNPSTINARTLFWYQNAPSINGSSATSTANFYIRSVTDYGLRIRGYAGGNAQAISNAIAKNVIGQTSTTWALSEWR